MAWLFAFKMSGFGVQCEHSALACGGRSLKRNGKAVEGATFLVYKDSLCSYFVL